MLPLLTMIGVLALLLTSSFTPRNSVSSQGLATAKALRVAEPVTIHTTITGVEEDGTTYTGVVEISGCITASGTYVMPTEAHGMALHCILELDLPNGNITITMKCNMKTLNGQWQVVEGTGAYQELKGGGSLVMINQETEEILTGKIRW